MAHPGFATAEGTGRFAEAHSPVCHPAHFRESDGLRLSSIGIGTYLGEADEATDAAYRASVAAAVRGGCNVIDAAINYRFQRSERSVGAALDDLLASGDARREGLVASTKGGFIPFDGHPPGSPEEFAAYMREVYFDPGVCAPEDIVANCHCMTPAYLRHELEASLANLGLETLDIYYVHNPETQLQELSREVFLARLRDAFEALEGAVSEGKIKRYGLATWNGYRLEPDEREYLSLEETLEAARAAGGEDHHFRAVQLPLNLGMTEAFSRPNQSRGGETRSFLAAAAESGLTVMTSGSILQGRAAEGLPPVIAETFPGFSTDAQRAIQFTRSAPGAAVALVGMRQMSHVLENMKVAEAPPAPGEDFIRLFRREA